MNEKNRIHLWDNLKFVLITLVVIGHFAEQYMDSPDFKSIFIFIYTFHMPMFFFLSGMFHKNENITTKVYSFITLGLVFKITMFIIRNITGEDIGFYLSDEASIPWFMFVMAIFTLLSYLLRDINTKYVFIISLILACFSGYDSSISALTSRIIIFYPFYVLGNIMKGNKILTITRKPVFQISGIFIIFIWAFLCLFKLDVVYALRPLFTGKNPFNQTFYHGGCLYRLLCYAISGVVGWSLICIIPNKKIPLITEIGRKTLQIYFWHAPVYTLIRNYGIATIICATTIGKLFYLLCAIIVTILLSTKIFSFPTTHILKYCRKK